MWSPVSFQKPETSGWFKCKKSAVPLPSEVHHCCGPVPQTKSKLFLLFVFLEPFQLSSTTECWRFHLKLVTPSRNKATYPDACTVASSLPVANGISGGCASVTYSDLFEAICAEVHNNKQIFVCTCELGGRLTLVKAGQWAVVFSAPNTSQLGNAWCATSRRS